MKKRTKCIVICVTLAVVLSAAAVLLFVRFPVKVDNETPADELITEDYPLGKLLKLNAVAAVSESDGIARSDIRDLADWLGIKLECKRQTAPDVYYYIVAGDGYRCFLFTDENEIITRVILTREFASIQEIKGIIDELDKFGFGVTVDETQEMNLRDSFYICGRSLGRQELYFWLEDGVMIMRRPLLSSDASPEYLFFTEQEWQAVLREDTEQASGWSGKYDLLPMDKEDWHENNR